MDKIALSSSGPTKQYTCCSVIYMYIYNANSLMNLQPSVKLHNNLFLNYFHVPVALINLTCL